MGTWHPRSLLLANVLKFGRDVNCLPVGNLLTRAGCRQRSRLSNELLYDLDGHRTGYSASRKVRDANRPRVKEEASSYPGDAYVGLCSLPQHGLYRLFLRHSHSLETSATMATLSLQPCWHWESRKELDVMKSYATCLPCSRWLAISTLCLFRSNTLVMRGYHFKIRGSTLTILVISF